MIIAEVDTNITGLIMLADKRGAQRGYVVDIRIALLRDKIGKIVA